MTKFLLAFLCDPVSKDQLTLLDAAYDSRGNIISGSLVHLGSGRRFPIINGIPRFVEDRKLYEETKAFGDQWNYFNFDKFEQHWVAHTVTNTFGSEEFFRGKIIVDAGCGAGMQTLWMLKRGARHVIALDLSNSVDDVVRRNLNAYAGNNCDVIQCSINQPPLKSDCIEDLVLCHNVIQHTPSVEKTAAALFDIVKPGGEFVFNCYDRQENPDALRRLKWSFYQILRSALMRLPFGARLCYARVMGAMRLLPVIGRLMEKIGLCVTGDVPRGPEAHWKQLYRATVINTFDFFGAHTYQHRLTDRELKTLVAKLQPDSSLIGNFDRYFDRGKPYPHGIALRLRKVHRQSGIELSRPTV